MNFKKFIPYIAALLVLAGLVAIGLTIDHDDDPDPTESTSITEITTDYTPSPEGTLGVR